MTKFCKKIVILFVFCVGATKAYFDYHVSEEIREVNEPDCASIPGTYFDETTKECSPCSECDDFMYERKACTPKHNTQCGFCGARMRILNDDFIRKCSDLGYRSGYLELGFRESNARPKVFRDDQFEDLAEEIRPEEVDESDIDDSESEKDSYEEYSAEEVKLPSPEERDEEVSKILKELRVSRKFDSSELEVDFIEDGELDEQRLQASRLLRLRLRWISIFMLAVAVVLCVIRQLLISTDRNQLPESDLAPLTPTQISVINRCAESFRAKHQTSYKKLPQPEPEFV